MTDQNKSTLILPISGGYCVNQMAIVIQLQKVGYLPHIICGSSGGALTGLISNNSDWDSTASEFERKFFEITDQIDHTFYGKSPNILLSGLVFAKTVVDISRSLLQEPAKKEAASLISFSFDKQPELWINTYCVETNKETLWCTKDFDWRKYSKHETDVIGCDKTFCRVGSIDELFTVTRASMAIPSVVPGVKIRDGEIHYDAGVISPSPFNSLKFRYLPGNKDLDFNMVYVSPANYSLQRRRFLKNNTFSNMVEGMREIIYGLCVGDIQGCLNMLFLDPGLKYYGGNSLCELQSAVGVTSSSARKSFLLVCPGEDLCVNITNMKKGDVTDLIQKSSEHGFIFHHWYVMK